MDVLSDEAVTEALAGLGDGWEHDTNALTKTFEFAGFGAAIDFMAAAAPRIDELDHHPEWTNVYARVDVRLTSHDVGGVTERDLTVARLLDELAAA